MNNDKTQIVNAARTKGLGDAAYAAQLRKACELLLTDVGKADGIPQAPLPGLNKDWDFLVTATRKYAESCIHLADHPTSANYNSFTSTLQNMNAASQGLDEAIQSAEATGH
jgi:hypothetical protein